MEKFNRNGDRFNHTVPVKSKKSSKDIIREIADYSFQKDAYMGHRIAGEYLIAYMVEKRRETQSLKEGESVMEQSQNENAFIGIAIHSASDLHFIENLIVTVTVIDEKELIIGKQRHFVHKSPKLHYYGKNWALPGDGLYTIRVQIDSSNLKDGKNQEDVEVEFTNVMIYTGQDIN